MRKLIVILFLHLMILQPIQVLGQDLEDTIEDELDGDSGGDDAAPMEELDEGEDEDISDEDLDEADVEPESSAETAPTPEPTESVEPEADIEAEAEEKPTAPAKNIYAETLGGFDENANSEFESRLFRIFAQRQNVDPNRWSALIAPHASGLYRVQKGDTLWDISRTFFGDGQFWPKLWAENGILTNPHEIVPGKGIAFIAGTEESAPTVNVTDLRIAKEVKLAPTRADAEHPAPVYPDDPEAQLSEEDIAAGTVLEEQQIVGGRPDIPEPLTVSRKPLKRFPPSFVEPVPPKVAREYDSSGLDVGRRNAVDVPAVVYLTSYLSDGKPDSFGQVEEIILQEKTAGFLQEVIVKLDRVASPGERLSAIMPRGKVSHAKSKTYGPVVDIGGTLEIRDVVDEGKHAYRAVVIRSINPIEVGALISDQELPTASYARNATRADVQARVIGGEFEENRKYLGPGSVIYLDQGSTSGLAEGQILAVRSRRADRREASAYPEVGEPVAVVKIGRVLERVSTALIVDAYAEVSPGDLTGGPFPRPARAIGGPRKSLRAKNIEVITPDSAEEKFTEDTDEDLDLEDEMD